jgi:Fe-S cluster biosynthesis and repair protein YggX
MATVNCVRCGQTAEGLAAPPFRPGTRLADLGQQIHQGVCAACYRAWIDLSVKLVNETRMDTTDPRSQELWLEQMRAFLNLDGGSAKDPWSRFLNRRVRIETLDGRQTVATLVGASSDQLSFAEFDGDAMPEGFAPSAMGARGSASIARDHVVALQPV